MKKEHFKIILRLAALLVPVYFVFYPRLHENQDELFTKSLWKFTIAGFCFYAILITVLLILK